MSVLVIRIMQLIVLMCRIIERTQDKLKIEEKKLIIDEALLFDIVLRIPKFYLFANIKIPKNYLKSYVVTRFL